MRAAVFVGPNRPLELATVPRPEPAPGELLVRVAACGLCHSDLHYLDHGVRTFKPPPLILGHEISGTVAALGPGVEERWRGARVLLSSLVTCGACLQCRTGRENICANSKMIGNSVDGGFAEFVAMPARDVMPMPAEIPLEDGCVIGDALTTAYHAVARRGAIAPGETVAVFGCGGVGSSVVQVAAMLGARVIAVDVDPRKLALARELGAAVTVDGDDPDVVKAVRRETGGAGVDAAIEAIGLPATQEKALASLRAGGRVVLLGFAAEPMSLPGGRVTYRELTVIGTLGCRNVDFPLVLDLVRRGRLSIAPLVTHRHRLEEINDGFDALRRGEGVRHIVVFS